MLAVEPITPTPSPSSDLEQVFQNHYSMVFGAAVRVTGSAQDAEDVLQTIFLRLLRRQDSLDLRPNAGGYLRRAAVNASLDLLRARSRSSSVPLDDFDSLADGQGESDPSRRQSDREMRRGLRQALLALPPKGAEIFTMRFIEGMPNREIATALDMSQAAVGVALHRARNQVKKELATFVGGT